MPTPGPLPRIDDGWTVINGLRLCTITSAGPGGNADSVVVLVHGFAVSTGYLRPLAAMLADRWPVAAADLPGHGGSGDPPHPFDLDQHAATLLAWMDVLGIERCVLLGHSMGCQIAARIAARHPGRVRRLVLLSPTVDPRIRGFWPLVWRLARDLRYEPPRLVLMQARDYLRSGLVRNLRTLRFVLADRIEDRLPVITASTLVVRGERDPVASHDWCERMTGLLPRGQLATIPRAGHGVPYSEPDALARLIADFLASAD